MLQPSWTVNMGDITYHSRFIQISFTTVKRKPENDKKGPWKLCLPLIQKVVMNDILNTSILYTDHPVCITCPENQLECSPHWFPAIQLTPQVPSQGIRAEFKLLNRDSNLASIKFRVRAGNHTFIDELLLMKTVFLVLSGVLCYYFFKRNSCKDINLTPVVEAHRERHAELKLIARQIVLQIFMNDPFYIFVLIQPSIIRYDASLISALPLLR